MINACELGMELGVCTRSVDLIAAEYAEVASTAEKAGYSSMWVTEEIGRSGFSTLAYAAGRTGRITLGTAIVSIYSRTPLTMAMEAATLSELSGGRFILGLGAGGLEFTTRGHGVAASKPVKRMEEYLSIIRGYLSGCRVSFAGEFFNIKDMRLWVKTQHTPKIYVAALNEKMLQLAGKMADGIILNMFSPKAMSFIRENVEKGASESGRRLEDLRLYSFVLSSASSSDDALTELRRSVAFYCAAPTYRRILNVMGYGDVAEEVDRLWRAGEREKAIKAISEELVEAVSIVADQEEETWEKLKQYTKNCVIPLLYPQPRRAVSKQDIITIIERCSNFLQI
ncbi:MAG: LLM class flavin-dependent oxidoreductase [Aigarchaeota archaeon]|nr:LLM class flavin-dependent oxidoreductase [Candidatus Pelearchaeum maunauluense]